MDFTDKLFLAFYAILLIIPILLFINIIAADTKNIESSIELKSISVNNEFSYYLVIDKIFYKDGPIWDFNQSINNFEVEITEEQYNHFKEVIK